MIPVRKIVARSLDLILSRVVLRSTGIVILAGILWFIDLRRVWVILRESNLRDVAVGLILFFPLAFTKASRWNLIKRKLGISVPFTTSFLYQMIGQMAFFTPGKIGDFIKAIYLKGENHSLTNGVISIVGDRLFDVVTMGLIGGISFVYFFEGILLRNVTVIALLTLTVLMVLILVVRYRRRVLDLVRTVVMFFVPGKFQNRVRLFLSDLKGHVKNYSAGWLSSLFLISLGAFALQVLRIYLFARAIGIAVPFLPLAGIIALMSLSNLLPISVVGLGTRDAVFLYFFGLLGVQPEKAIGLSILVFASIVLIAGLASLLFVAYPPSVKVSSVFDGTD